MGLVRRVARNVLAKSEKTLEDSINAHADAVHQADLVEDVGQQRVAVRWRMAKDIFGRDAAHETTGAIDFDPIAVETNDN